MNSHHPATHCFTLVAPNARAGGRVHVHRFLIARALLGIPFIVLSLVLSWNTILAADSAAVASQAATTTVVVGANNPAIDVPAVQAAVDQGGTVILEGTFDFGTDSGNHIIVPGRLYPDQDRKGASTVFIHERDVTIRGETLTTSGGVWLDIVDI